MNVLIIKLGATGDVVRTTPLLHRLNGSISWLTASKNVILLDGLYEKLRCLSWEQRDRIADAPYDLVVNLEDSYEVASFLGALNYKQLFGAHLNTDDKLSYTNDSSVWFDLSIISSHGKQGADQLKLRNRRSYQELIFHGLGLNFTGETYVLPDALETDLAGDIAIASEAGPVWPMKRWAFYSDLKARLEAEGLKVSILPARSSLLEHLSDVQNHRCVVGGDSLPMHFALGTRTPCVTLFTCTSPWEIYDYGAQTKIVSPLLEEFFYKRGYDERATTAITVDEVFAAVMTQLEKIASRPITGAVTR
jgi:ADP-heptose:LPS heptosyltransferase